MTLSYPGAQEFVTAIWYELRGAGYPLPKGFIANDEPSGDFGIAHTWGLSNGLANFTFDAGRIPNRYTVVHEIGHAISAEWARRRDIDQWSGGMYDAFWAARNFPGTAWQAQLNAIEVSKTSEAKGWRLWPEESFADCFACSATGYGEGSQITEGYGVHLDVEAMRHFYKNLEDNMAITDDDISRIADAVIAKFNAGPAKDLASKLDSGFNVTLTTIADRLAAGDKHTATEPVD